jgi:cell wall-associated NlpC family hydrolase
VTVRLRSCLAASARRRAALGAALALALLSPLAATAGPDQPPPTGDAITRFLSERGLLNPKAIKQAPLVQQVRDKASGLVISAMNFLGVRYRWGGDSVEEGFDCSGFTRHVFDRSIGLLLPRRAEEQARDPNLKAVGRDELKPGDLVFFHTLKRAFSHVGIYIGEGKFIHAPRTGAEIRIEDMRQSYWARRFSGARRSPLMEQPSAPAEPATLGAAAPVPGLSALTGAKVPAAAAPAQAPATQLAVASPAAAGLAGAAPTAAPALVTSPAAPSPAPHLQAPALPAPLEAPPGLQALHVAPPLHADGH